MTIAGTRISPFFFLLPIAFCAALLAHAQQAPPSIPPQQAVPSVTGIPPGSDPLMGDINEKMAIKRNNQRQKKIVSESTELLSLAQKLNADVARSNKDQLSVAVVKEADAIEKLAKSIKDKMSNGY
jgi:hypothetical protein